MIVIMISVCRSHIMVMVVIVIVVVVVVKDQAKQLIVAAAKIKVLVVVVVVVTQNEQLIRCYVMMVHCTECVPHICEHTEIMVEVDLADPLDMNKDVNVDMVVDDVVA